MNDDEEHPGRGGDPDDFNMMDEYDRDLDQEAVD